MYIVCCVLAQILYWEKSCSLDIKPKCSHPIRLQDFEINYFSRAKQNSLIISPEQNKTASASPEQNKTASQKLTWGIWSLDTKIDCI